MNKQTLANFARNTRLSLSKHSPAILMGIGIAGAVTSTVLAVKATPKAMRLMEEKKRELDTETLTPTEVVKTTWKCYLPAAATGAAALTCLITSHSVNTKRGAAAAAAYKLTESAFSDYREKVVETIGEKKERTIRDKVSEEQVKKNSVNRADVIVTGRGKTLCFDPLSSRYFYSDLEKIKRAQNEINNRIICDAFDGGASVNDFYDEIGLPGTDLGETMGWKVGNLIDIYPSAQIAGEDTDHEGEPCIVLNHCNPPQYEYHR